MKMLFPNSVALISTLDVYSYIFLHIIYIYTLVLTWVKKELHLEAVSGSTQRYSQASLNRCCWEVALPYASKRLLSNPNPSLRHWTHQSSGLLSVQHGIRPQTPYMVWFLGPYSMMAFKLDPRVCRRMGCWALCPSRACLAPSSNYPALF